MLQKTAKTESPFRLTNIFFCVVTFYAYSPHAVAQLHPQAGIFGSESLTISVGQNPAGTIRLINPAFQGQNFGIFKIPRQEEFLKGENQGIEKIFAVGREYPNNTRNAFVPPETGRAILLAPSAHPVYRDVLIKGTGAVEKFTTHNQLRPKNLGFDGYFEISEAVRDMVTAEILHQAGVLVARGLIITDHHQWVHRNGLPDPVRVGNYARAFRVQTRLSNLANLTPDQRKLAIDDAIKVLQTLHKTLRPMTYVEYFHYMLQKMAKNVAIYQAIGFTQDSLHYGQITLAGEMVDLGVGSFAKPSAPGVVNTKYPWFRYERQPLLLQNMLYKTHSVKAEPLPVELPADSDTVLNQKTLYSFIQSFDPAAAERIEAMNPVKMYWQAYEQYYRKVDSRKFKIDVLDKLERYYDWSPDQYESHLNAETKAKVLADYSTEMGGYTAGLQRPGRTGQTIQITSIEKQRIFVKALRQNKVFSVRAVTLFASNDWQAESTENLYVHEKVRSVEADLSWKPENLESFQLKKSGAHPLAAYLKSGGEALEAGRKIIWMTDAGVSPFAVIRKVSPNKTCLVSFEHPATGVITDQIATEAEILKLNDASRSIRLNDVISGTRITLSADAKNKVARLGLRIAELRKQKREGESDEVLQVKALQEVVSAAYTDYVANLSSADRAEYDARLQMRLKGTKPSSLNWGMVRQCGNCMDQNLFTNTLLSQLSEDLHFQHHAYIAHDKGGGHHFFTIVTLQPSQEQYVLESSFPGNRVFSLRQASVFNRFPLTQIVDQHKVDQRILPVLRPALCGAMFSAPQFLQAR